MSLRKEDVIAYFQGIEDSGLIIVHPMTSESAARHFKVSFMEGAQLVDMWKRGDLGNK